MRHVSPAALALAAVAAAGFVGSALAQQMPPTPEQRARAASDVVVGTVLDVYERTGPPRDDRTHLLVEVAVERVEKGDGERVGGVAYLHAWRRASSPTGASCESPGHEDVPAPGRRVRAFGVRGESARADGHVDPGVEAFFPRAFEEAATDAAGE